MFTRALNTEKKFSFCLGIALNLREFRLVWSKPSYSHTLSSFQTHPHPLNPCYSSRSRASRVDKLDERWRDILRLWCTMGSIFEWLSSFFWPCLHHQVNEWSSINDEDDIDDKLDVVVVLSFVPSTLCVIAQPSIPGNQPLSTTKQTVHRRDGSLTLDDGYRHPGKQQS